VNGIYVENKEFNFIHSFSTVITDIECYYYTTVQKIGSIKSFNVFEKNLFKAAFI